MSDTYKGSEYGTGTRPSDIDQAEPAPPISNPLKGLRNDNELAKELENIFNRLSIDSQLNTPDYMLAEYVVSHLTDIKLLIDCRRSWGCK